ncbi:MAG: flagellar hook protein, partial [Deltaproteobacteria bacterium]|nr:flagellar hook protein [Deltaproteobacteria bacterium]
MSLSTNLISGLSSGFDWRGMIDQLMAIEHQRVDIVENRKSEYESKLSAFRSVNTMLLSLKTQSVTLAKRDSFNVYTTSLTTTSSNYSASDFMTVTTSADAAPGSHTIEMTTSSSIAQARKISSRSFSSYNEALSLTGEFIINGRAVRVDDTDDLTGIRDKINNVNSGSNATGVTASILTVSDTDYRLILTSDNTGKDAFSIFDASADTVNNLQNTSTGLGFLDDTPPTIKNSTSDGAESGRFSSSEVAIGSLLGLTGAQTGTSITIGGGTVDINLVTQSLTTIAGNIDALAGVSASVKSVTEDGTTSYYIDISGTTGFGDKNNVLQTLGILVGGQGAVAEVHTGDTANTKTTAGTDDPVDAATKWGDIDTSGDGSNTNNVTNADTISISGIKHDGTSVSGTYTISDKTVDTMQGLLTEIETVFGLDAGSATIVDGKIQVADSTAGDSALNISLIANNEGGGTLDLGTLSASTEGYKMQTAEGKDSSVRIDGTTITGSTNVITDVISGVTINLKKIE